MAHRHKTIEKPSSYVCSILFLIIMVLLLVLYFTIVKLKNYERIISCLSTTTTTTCKKIVYVKPLYGKLEVEETPNGKPKARYILCRRGPIEYYIGLDDEEAYMACSKR